MPDVAFGGEAWALFKLVVKKNNLGEKPLEVLRCNVSYIDNEGKQQRHYR